MKDFRDWNAFIDLLKYFTVNKKCYLENSLPVILLNAGLSNIQKFKDVNPAKISLKKQMFLIFHYCRSINLFGRSKKLINLRKINKNLKCINTLSTDFGVESLCWTFH